MVTEQAKKRFVYIDLLRGWAVLVMVEVHVVNAFLMPEYRAGSWFPILNFINGLVAPAFLFISGYAFTLVGQRKWNDYLAMNSVFRRQIVRIAQVWIVGYALHIPAFSLKILLSLPAAGWNDFWKVDVLHAIAFSLAVLIVCVIVFRTTKRYFFAILIISLVTVFISPLLYGRNLDSSFPLWFSNYLGAAHGSLFPLFPWMAFVLAGGITAQLVLWGSSSKGPASVMTYVASAGTGMIILSLISVLTPFTIYPEHDFWRSSPAFFFIRLGIVLMLLSGLWYWEQTKKSGTSFVSIVGSESLVAYAGHLLVIFGLFFNNQSLSSMIGTTRTIPEVAGMTLLLAGLTTMVSYYWHRMKKWSMFYARVFQYSLLIIAVYVFLTKSV